MEKALFLTTLLLFAWAPAATPAEEVVRARVVLHLARETKDTAAAPLNGLLSRVASADHLRRTFHRAVGTASTAEQAQWQATAGELLAANLENARLDGQVVPGRVLLNVSVARGTLPGDLPARWANGLARAAAEAVREEYCLHAAADVEAAQAGRQRASALLAAARRQLDEFLAAHFAQLPALAREPAHRPAQALPADNTPTEDPDLAAARRQLESQLAQLQGKRAALLRERMPEHPSVIQVENDIRAVLAARDVLPAPPARVSAPVAVAPVEPPPLTAAEVTAMNRQYTALRAAVEQAAREEQRLAAVELQAWSSAHEEPRLEIELARLAAPGSAVAELACAAPPPAGSRGGLALAVVSGVGLAVAGFWFQRRRHAPLHSAAEVERELGLPVLGAM